VNGGQKMTKQELYDAVNDLCDGEAGHLKNSRYLKDAVSRHYKLYGRQIAKMNDRQVEEKNVPLAIREMAADYYKYSHENDPILIGEYDQLTTDALLGQVMPYIQTVRRQIFGSPDAPFKTTREAIRWIENKDEEPLPEDIKRKKDRLIELHNQYVDMVKKGEVAGARLGWKREFLDYPGADGWTHCVVSSGKVDLEILEKASTSIAMATGFQAAQVTAYILTGIKPTCPRFQAVLKQRLNELPTGEAIKRCSAEVIINASDLSFDDVKRIYGFYREVLNIKGVKSATDKQKNLLSFVLAWPTPPPENRKGTKAYWENVMSAWNNEVSEDLAYTSWEGIRKAYLGAVKKTRLLGGK
jgi:hypothetical protein